MIQPLPFALITPSASHGEILRLVTATVIAWHDVFQRGVCLLTLVERHADLCRAVNALADQIRAPVRLDALERGVALGGGAKEAAGAGGH